MAYHSKFTGKEVDDILDSVSGKQDKLSETNQVQKGQIADRAVESKNVAINAITTSKIKDGNVTTEKIADNAISNDKLADLVVTTDKIASQAVKMTHIADGAVSSVKLADEAVVEAKIAPRAVTTSRIANGSVWYEKLSGVVQNQLVDPFNFSTEDIANWSGTDTHFKTTFGYALSAIINRAGVRTVRVNFTYQSTRYDALACCTTPSATVRSVSFLIHNSDGLTELISMNLDGSNVTVTNEALGGLK